MKKALGKKMTIGQSGRGKVGERWERRGKGRGGRWVMWKEWRRGKGGREGHGEICERKKTGEKQIFLKKKL